MSVAASIWVLAFAQGHWDRAGKIARAMGRAAYAPVCTRSTQSCCHRFRESIATPNRLAIRQMERASHSGRCLSSARTMRSSSRPSGR
jgi:hypothetical protein